MQMQVSRPQVGMRFRPSASSGDVPQHLKRAEIVFSLEKRLSSNNTKICRWRVEQEVNNAGQSKEHETSKSKPEKVPFHLEDIIVRGSHASTVCQRVAC